MGADCKCTAVGGREGHDADLLADHLHAGATAGVAALHVLRVLGAASAALLAQDLLPDQHLDRSPDVEILEAHLEVHVDFWAALLLAALVSPAEHLGEDVERVVALAAALFVFLDALLALLIVDSSLLGIAEDLVCS